MTPWLVTGAAGFVGYHVAERLTAEGEPVLGIDNLDDYYDPGLKKARLEQLADRPEFEFRYIDLTDPGAVAHTFESTKWCASPANEPSPTPPGSARTPTRQRAGTCGGCSTSATANRSPSTGSSSCWRGCWNGPPTGPSVRVG